MFSKDSNIAMNYNVSFSKSCSCYGYLTFKCASRELAIIYCFVINITSVH